MRISILLCWIVGMTLCLGCESSGPGEAATQSAEVSAPPPPTPAKSADEAADDAPAADAAAPAEEAAPAETPAEPAAEPGDSERATVGAGAKGRDYGGPGFVTTPIEALFRADDLIVFESHIPKNLSLYKAEHDNKGPKTHEEFMQVIIKDGGVRLPELPQGDEYWYDPKTEQLMVRHPKPAEE